MNNNQSAIDQARDVVIDKLAAYRSDSTGKRLRDLKAAIEGWHRTVVGKAEPRRRA